MSSPAAEPGRNAVPNKLQVSLLHHHSSPHLTKAPLNAFLQAPG